MGDVMLVYRIMPEDPDADLERIKGEVEKIAEDYGTYKESSEEKVAFGLMAVISSVVIPDEGGIVDEMEEELRGIEGIQSVESVDITVV